MSVYLHLLAYSMTSTGTYCHGIPDVGGGDGSGLAAVVAADGHLLRPAVCPHPALLQYCREQVG